MFKTLIKVAQTKPTPNGMLEENISNTKLFQLLSQIAEMSSEKYETIPGMH